MKKILLVCIIASSIGCSNFVSAKIGLRPLLSSLFPAQPHSANSTEEKSCFSQVKINAKGAPSIIENEGETKASKNIETYSDKTPFKKIGILKELGYFSNTLFKRPIHRCDNNKKHRNQRKNILYNARSEAFSMPEITF